MRSFGLTLVATLVALTTPTTTAGQTPETMAPGWRVGGGVGLSTLGGDFNVSAGVGGLFEGVYLGESGLGVALIGHGSIHGSNVEGSVISTVFAAVEPRYALSVGKGSSSWFVGARVGLGVWGGSVPNPITLEYTNFEALGWEVGPVAGVSGAVGDILEFGLTVSYVRMGFGDLKTEAYSFADTDASGRQLMVVFTLHQLTASDGEGS